MAQTLYPDILGVIANERLTVQDALQYAVGIFPNTTTLGQPVEVLVLLQNALDQPMRLQVSVRTPARDAEGNLLNFFTPKPRLAFTLPGSECGLLHVPVTPQLPTPPGNGYPVLVQVDVQKPGDATLIRSYEGGPVPSLLAISPFRITVLRSINFTAQTMQPDHVGVTLDVLPGHIPPRGEEPMPRYEALWTSQDLQQEQARVKAVAGEALRFAKSLTRTALFPLLHERTREAYGSAGMPLHPGETVVIAKTLTYVMEDGLDLEPGFSLAGSHWFERLCQLMAADPDVIQNDEKLINLLYSAVVHDAVMLGFCMIAHDTKIDCGDDQEQIGYASRLVAALEGRVPVSLEHIYLPLVLAGTMLTARVIGPSENPWRSLATLKEARDGRVSLAGATLREVFDILNRLIERAERQLWELKIPRE